jgi:hypothetical protein
MMDTRELGPDGEIFERSEVEETLVVEETQIPSDSQKKRPRLNWTTNQTLVLLQLKRKEHESQKLGKGLSFVSREKKWQKIVDYLLALPIFEGVDIDVPWCIDKWDNIQAVYKKFNQYINRESRTRNPWLLSREERKKANLPQYFRQEMYNKMSLWYGTSGRFSRNVPIVDSLKNKRT